MKDDAKIKIFHTWFRNHALVPELHKNKKVYKKVNNHKTVTWFSGKQCLYSFNNLNIDFTKNCGVSFGKLVGLEGGL